MAREQRIDPDNGTHHVFNRGNRKWDIFLDADDPEIFLGLIGEAHRRFGISVLAFCLMQNHFHLVVHCPSGGLSAALQFVESQYVQRFNRAHDFRGSLFEDRFESILVDSDVYLRQLMRYVERNPLEIGFEIESHPYSSLGYRIAQASPPQWLAIERSHEVAGGRAAYRQFVLDDQPTDVAPLAAGVRQMSLPARRNHSTERCEVIDAVVHDNLELASGWSLPARNEARDISIVLACERGVPTADVSRRYGLASSSSVRSAVRRLELRSRVDRGLQERLSMSRRTLEVRLPRIA